MQVCVFVSQKPAARPYPDGLNSKNPIHEHTEERGPSAFGTRPETGVPHHPAVQHGLQLQAPRSGPCSRHSAYRGAAATDSQRLRSEHLEWLAQLKGLARNLNQLTRLAHTQGFAAVAARHATLQAELVRMIEALRRDR
jgi:hypothetical protein